MMLGQASVRDSTPDCTELRRAFDVLQTRKVTAVTAVRVDGGTFHEMRADMS